MVSVLVPDLVSLKAPLMAPEKVNPAPELALLALPLPVKVMSWLSAILGRKVGAKTRVPFTPLRLTVGVVPSNVQVLVPVPMLTVVVAVAAAPLPLIVRLFRVSAAGSVFTVKVPLPKAVVVSLNNVTPASVADTGTPFTSQFPALVQA